MYNFILYRSEKTLKIANYKDIMNDSYISCDLALIGVNLELKRDVKLKIDGKGIIKTISSKPMTYPIDLLELNSLELMIPGLINSHVHIGDSFAKEKGFNKPLHEVVAPPNGIKHRLLGNTSNHIKILGIKKAVESMIQNGITCFVDFREGGIDGINLLKEALSDSPMDYLIFGRFEVESQIQSVYNLGDGIGLVTYKIVTEDIKKELEKCKKLFKKKIACHCAEKERKTTILKRIFQDNLIDIIVHGTKLEKPDLQLIQEKNISIVLCPRSNGYFGVGFPPISEILELRIPISIGTDNIMANSPNLFEELRYLYMISRVIEKSHNLNAIEMLKMITVNAAKNFGLDSMGTISEGKYANFFVIDLKDPNFFVPIIQKEEIFPIITQRLDSSNIKMTYIRGKLVYEKL
jgi:cytosine/adenosine deaminase-related metal-dependent hydrolase